MTDFDLLLKKPVERMSFASSSWLALAKSRIVGIFAEQAGCHFIDAFIGTLRRKDRGHQKLPRIRMMQGAGRVGIHLVQNLENLFDARGAFGGCLWNNRLWHNRL